MSVEKPNHIAYYLIISNYEVELLKHISMYIWVFRIFLFKNCAYTQTYTNIYTNAQR